MELFFFNIKVNILILFMFQVFVYVVLTFLLNKVECIIGVTVGLRLGRGSVNQSNVYIM